MLGGATLHGLGGGVPQFGTSYFGSRGKHKSSKGYMTKESRIGNFASGGSGKSLGPTAAFSPGEQLYRQHFNQIGAFIDQKAPAGGIRVPAEYGQGEAYQSALRQQYARLHGRARDFQSTQAKAMQQNPEKLSDQALSGGPGADVNMSIAAGAFGGTI